MWKKVLIFVVVFMLFTFGAFAKTLFYDDFNDGKIADVYIFSGKDLPQTLVGKPEWVEKNGVISQVSESQGDECHVAVEMDFPELITIQAKIMFLTWANGDSARGGIGLRIGKNSGRGMNFLFHNTQDTIQFLNDQIAWGDSGTYDFEIKKWYWTRFYIDGDAMLHAKTWQELDDEPNGWMLEQAHFGDARDWQDSYPSLNGGTSPHGGSATMSFDDLQIWDQDGPSPLSVLQKTFLTTTWGAIKY